MLRVVWPRLVVAALMLVTAVAGSLHLGYRGLSFDEAVSLRRAGESWSHLSRTVTGEDPNMSIYYILLKVWSGAFGDGVLAARSLSVMFAVLTVPVVYALGGQLFDRRAGLAAAALLALNAYFLRYAQEARAYSMVTLLVTVSSYAFVLSLTRPRLSLRAAYVASSALAFYAHYFAAWVILAQLIVLIATRRRLIDRAWIIAYGAIGLIVLPMAYWALTLDHNPIGWLSQPGWRSLWDSSAQLSGDSFRQVGGVLAVCLLALPWAARSRRLRWGLLFTALWVVVPMVGAFTVSQFHPILDAKYLLVCVPGLMLLTAGAVTSLRPLTAAAAVFVALILLNGPPLRAWYRWHGEPDWQGLTTYVEADMQPRDGLVINGSSARSEFERFSPDSFARSTDASLDPFGPRRVWFVRGYGAQATAAQQGRLRRAYVLVKQRSFEGATAELYARK
jgi:mannosyltransferase